MPSARLRLAPPSRGAASLIVVTILFFLLALVAAYTSRNLIFEQRTSVNQYRAMQAFEAAEAGLEWSLALLNGGRIGSSCVEAGASGSDSNFRQRYLRFDVVSASPTAGRISPLLESDGVTPLRPSCVWTGTGWRCSCPVSAAPAVVLPSGTGIFPAFRVRFSSAGVSRPGVVRVLVTACTRYDNACLDSTAVTVDQEGRAQLSALVVLRPVIPSAVAAALTARGALTVEPGAEITLSGGDQAGQAGRLGGVASASGVKLLPAGTPRALLLLENDNTLRPPPAPAALDANRDFGMLFGAGPSTYRLQPASITLDCASSGCSTQLADAVAKNPDRVIWVTGDLNVEAAGDIGAASTPVVIVVGGNLQLAAGAQIFGVVYLRGSSFTGTGNVTGALVAEQGMTVPALSTPSVTLDPGVLEPLVWRSGSFVRAPGGWRDFP